MQSENSNSFERAALCPSASPFQLDCEKTLEVICFVKKKKKKKKKKNVQNGKNDGRLAGKPRSRFPRTDVITRSQPEHSVPSSEHSGEVAE